MDSINLNDKEKSKTHALKAYEYAPNDQLVKDNLKWFE